MHTVVETPYFIAKSKKLLSVNEYQRLIASIAFNPLAGDVVEGTGGFRKIRLARDGAGKSGGFRVIYYFLNDSMPVYLFDVYAKSSQSNLTTAQKNALKTAATAFKKS